MLPGGSPERTNQQLDRLRSEYGDFEVADEETVVPRAMYTDCLRAAESRALGGARVFVRKGDDVVFLRYQHDPEVWDVPGGSTERGESFAETATRHVRAAVGIDCKITGVARVLRETFTLVAGGDGATGLWVFFDAEVDDVFSETGNNHEEAGDGLPEVDDDCSVGADVLDVEWFAPENVPEAVDPEVRDHLDAQFDEQSVD